MDSVTCDRPETVYDLKGDARLPIKNVEIRHVTVDVYKRQAFMASFVNYDSDNERYIIQGACAANESYNEETTLNPAFEMAYCCLLYTSRCV